MGRPPCRFPPGPLLRIPDDLDVESLASEEVRHLTGARVVMAEYDVLQHDFPELSNHNLAWLNPQLRTLSPDEQVRVVREIIDGWLLWNAAYVSAAQASQTVFNTAIGTDGSSATAYRPPMYGRSVVIPTRMDGAICRSQYRYPGSKGLLDLKGAGLSPRAKQSKGTLRNGLDYVGFALSDFFIKMVIDSILARELPTVWTVPVYAVLDLGFDVVDGNHGTAPAGMHVRRAHRRRFQPPALPCESKLTLEIELALRRYGVTTAARPLQLHISRQSGQVTWQKGRETPTPVTEPERIGASLTLLRDSQDLTLDRRDVQMARDVSWPPPAAQMVDFGAIRVESKFDEPMVRDFEGPLIDEVIWPHEAGFVQPDPDLQLPVAFWNRYRLKSRCFKMAEAFRRGDLSTDAIRRQLDESIGELTAKWDLTERSRSVSTKPGSLSQSAPNTMDCL